VSKVHEGEVRCFADTGDLIVLVGHARRGDRHDRQAPDAVVLVEVVEDAQKIELPEEDVSPTSR
jgi:hypothetical protein